MSLKLPPKKGLPVLDAPARFAGPKIFLTRRPLSVVGKPVLAEKHLPVQPSGSPLARKCYCCNSEGLFRFRRKTAGSRKFRPVSLSTPEPLPPFETRSLRPDGLPRQSPMQRSPFNCPVNGKPPLINQTAVFIEPAGLNNRKPGMHTAFCRLSKCPFHADRSDAGFRFISDEARRLCRIEKFTDEQINSSPGSFMSVLSAKKRNRKFVCATPVLKTSADYLNASPAFFNGIDKRRPLPLKVSPYEAESTDFLMQTRLNRSISQPVFAAFLEFSPEKRILEHEKHENFVLENKIIFSPDFLRKKINLTHNQTLVRSCPEKQKKFGNLLNRIIPATLNEASDKPVDRISKITGHIFPVCSPKNILQRVRGSAESGVPDSPRREPRFRLKLRLQRQNFPAISLPFSPILPEKPFALPHATKCRIQADFTRVRSTNSYSRLFPVESASAAICAPADYHARKANFMVGAAKHARYTLSRVRNIILPGQIKSLARLELVCPDFLKTGSRRSSSPGKNYLALKFDRTGIKFSNKDMSLSLLGRNPAITSILAGTMPRRLRPATPQPLPDMRIEQSPKRRKPLRMLRFKLHSINEGFESSKLRPRKKIEKETSFFPTCPVVARTLPAGDIDRFIALKTFRQPRLKSGLRLRRFALQQIIPAQIMEHLHLEMKICSDAGYSRMPARHFIIPDFAAKSLRQFYCRISLLPHPFGFPAFSFSEPRFYSLCSQPVFAPDKPQTGNLTGTGSFILKKDPLFLPPLSMKNPRRLLYNHLNPARASKEFYLVGNLALKGSICPAPGIADFLHTWHGISGDCIMPAGTEKFHRRLRLRQPLLHHLPATTAKHSYGLKPCDTGAPVMPRITRLLLRARRFSTAVTQASTACGILPFAKLFRPCLQVPVPARPVGNEPQRQFSIFNGDISRLQQAPVFNDDVAASFKIQYHARFRSFRFPWRPEIRTIPIKTEEPGQPETGISVTAIALPDDLRSTAFISADAGTHTLPLSSNFTQIQIAMTRHQPEMRQSLKVERRFTLPEVAATGMCMQNPEKCLRQFINPETFFVMREKNRSRLKKNHRVYNFRNTAKTVQLRPARENYSEFGLKNRAVRKMPLESLHWIIMMRSFLQPAAPAMLYSINLPDTVRKYCSEMQASGSLPCLAFAAKGREKIPEPEAGPEIISMAILTRDVRFSALAFQTPARAEAKEFSAGYTAMPAAKREKAVNRPTAGFFAPVNQPAPVWQTVHNFTHNLIKAESENRFIETAMFKVEAGPDQAHVSIRRLPEAFRPAFVPEWIDQIWQRPVLKKRQIS